MFYALNVLCTARVHSAGYTVQGTQCIFIKIPKWQWRSELKAVLLINNGTWIEELFDRRCDVRSDTP